MYVPNFLTIYPAVPTTMPGGYEALTRKRAELTWRPPGGFLTDKPVKRPVALKLAGKL
jgi:hypothetical protein